MARQRETELKEGEGRLEEKPGGGSGMPRTYWGQWCLLFLTWSGVIVAKWARDGSTESTWASPTHVSPTGHCQIRDRWMYTQCVRNPDLRSAAAAYSGPQ